MKKYFFRREEDGAIIVYDDSPKQKKQAELLMKRPGFTLIQAIETPSKQSGAFKEVPIVQDTLECPLCGFVAKDENDLKLHKPSHS